MLKSLKLGLFISIVFIAIGLAILAVAASSPGLGISSALIVVGGYICVKL